MPLIVLHFFSSVDNEDEKGIRLYMVFGNLDRHTPGYALRVGVAGIFGEVLETLCSSTRSPSINSMLQLFLMEALYKNLPTEILQDDSLPRSEESCQRVNMRQPQHLVTNLLAANLLLKCGRLTD